MKCPLHIISKWHLRNKIFEENKFASLIEFICFNQCIYQKCIIKIYVIYHYVRQGLKQIMELSILKIACHKVSVDVSGEYSSARLGIAIRTRGFPIQIPLRVFGLAYEPNFIMSLPVTFIWKTLNDYLVTGAGSSHSDPAFACSQMTDKKATSFSKMTHKISPSTFSSKHFPSEKCFSCKLTCRVSLFEKQ